MIIKIFINKLKGVALRKDKERKLIYFPTNSNPYSLFYRFDNESLIYLDADMISLFNNEWM